MPGQLEHIIGVTGLLGVIGQFIVELACRTQIFIVAVAAGGIGMTVDDDRPKVPRDGAVVSVGIQLVLLLAADDLRYLGIGVFPGEIIQSASQRVDDPFVMEFVGKREIFFFARDGIGISQ